MGMEEGNQKVQSSMGVPPQSFSRVWLFATPWTLAHPAPLFM